MLSDAYLGLGSNLGDRRHNIAEAVRLLKGVSTHTDVSALYETAPEGFTGQPAFVNAVCRIWTRLDPFGLLAQLSEIQAAVDSRHAFVNGPRALDIDILLYGRRVIDSPSLTIPHPRLAEREFVLVPLTELVPGLHHPVFKKTIRSLLLRLAASGRLGRAVPAAGASTPR